MNAPIATITIDPSPEGFLQIESIVDCLVEENPADLSVHRDAITMGLVEVFARAFAVESPKREPFVARLYQREGSGLLGMFVSTGSFSVQPLSLWESSIFNPLPANRREQVVTIPAGPMIVLRPISGSETAVRLGGASSDSLREVPTSIPGLQTAASLLLLAGYWRYFHVLRSFGGGVSILLEGPVASTN